MKLMTINTHSLEEKNYDEKLQNFVRSIVKLQPDIIAMQEVNQSFGKAEAAALLQTGRHENGHESRALRCDNHAANVAEMLRQQGLNYHWTWIPMKYAYDKYDEGLAIFSKKPIAESRVLVISKDDDYEKWRTRYALGIRPAGTESWFYTAHFGWWDDELEPFAAQWQRLERELSSHEGRVYIMGDFNSPAAIRGEGYDFVTSANWHDTYIMAQNRDAGTTVQGIIDGWRGKLSEEEMLEGIRIDYIFCNEKVNVFDSRVCFNGKNEPVISDHYGVMINVGD